MASPAKGKLQDKSFTVTVSRRSLIVVSVVLVLTVLAAIGALFIQKESISSMVRSCVERYTKGIEYKTYKVSISFPIDSVNRDSLNQEQLSCISKKLGLSEEQKDSLLRSDEGQVDNDSFQVKWTTRTTCQFTDQDGLVPDRVSKYSDDNGASCLDDIQTLGPVVIRKLKEITVRDFRP